jgi:serine-threonine kinase receptor-associated protein
MTVTETKQYVPLTCHGHSRPVTHLNFSPIVTGEDGYYMISACKGSFLLETKLPVLTRDLDNNPMLRDGITGDWHVFNTCVLMKC